MLKLFVFGNPLVKEDALALEVAKRLKGVEVVECVEPEDLLGEETPVILDVVKGIRRVELVGVERLKKARPFAAHDFDLQAFLQLALRLGELKGVRIAGIPYGYPLGKAVEEVQALVGGLRP